MQRVRSSGEEEARADVLRRKEVYMQILLLIKQSRVKSENTCSESKIPIPLPGYIDVTPNKSNFKFLK